MSPVVDFLMLGGFTLLIIPIVVLPVWAGENVQWLLLGSFYLSFVLNMPHFIHSYQLLYGGYGKKLTGPVYGKVAKLRFLIAGILAPLAMLAFFAYAVQQPTNDLLGYSVNIMLFFTGWHYVKQGYGIMIALGVRKKAFFDKTEKNLLLANAYIGWIFGWIQANTVANSGMFEQIPFHAIGFSDEVRVGSQILFLCWTVGVWAFLFKRFDGHRSISINGMVAYLSSVYPWVVFANTHPHIIIFVPALHSLQYLLFVWKIVYERSKEELAQKAGAVDMKAVKVPGKMVLRRMLPFLTVGFGAGIVFFSLVPMALDSVVPYNTAVFGTSLFVFLFLIFINIHHYFIDFAIWRKENPEMKYLYR